MLYGVSECYSGETHPTTRPAEVGSLNPAADAKRVKEMELVFEPRIAGGGRMEDNRLNRGSLRSGISGIA